MRKLIAPAIGAIATLVLIAAPSADARSKYADVRVVTNTGETLADHRQYTDDVRVKASEDADCFGESSPSSNETYRLEEPNMLGALTDAAKNDQDLKPLLITDAFFDSYGFGVCDIGGVETEGFSYWYYAMNGAAATTGADQIPVANGDRHLWYLTTGNEPGFPAELVLKAPARVTPGEKFTVKVLRLKPDGTKTAAKRVRVTNALTRTDENGKAKVIVDAGRTDLVATGRPDDVPSAEVAVCAAEDPSECPRRRGKTIYGSPGNDEIEGTRGPDRIDCGRGEDVVRGAQQSDQIAGSCEKVKR